MTFSDQPFEQRFEQMGDQAEGAYEASRTKGFTRYGLDRPPIHMPSVPAFIRYTPDYLESKRLVEVQGFGRDQTIKLKNDKAHALQTWAEHHPVWIFLWDSHQRRWCELELGQLLAALYGEHGQKGSFDGGRNPYAAVHASHLEVEWHYVD